MHRTFRSARQGSRASENKCSFLSRYTGALRSMLFKTASASSVLFVLRSNSQRVAKIREREEIDLLETSNQAHPVQMPSSIFSSSVIVGRLGLNLGEPPAPLRHLGSHRSSDEIAQERTRSGSHRLSSAPCHNLNKPTPNTTPSPPQIHSQI